MTRSVKSREYISYVDRAANEHSKLERKLRVDACGNFVGVRLGNPVSWKHRHLRKLYAYYLRTEYNIIKKPSKVY